MHFVYHPGYDLNIGAHVFPAQKFRLTRESLLNQHLAIAPDFLLPAQATQEQLELAHDPIWIDKMTHGYLTASDVQRLEIPYSPQMAKAFLLAAGGTILAARTAMREGISYNIGGGFHHAFRGHGEGFCAINDIAVGIRTLQNEGLVGRAMVIDCDVHHGNGTAAIFAGDDSVFTISIQQLRNYPAQKPPSDVDVHLDDGVADDEYLAALSGAIDQPLRTFAPRLVVYVAGADPYEDDQLGGLSLSIEGLARRDKLVITSAREAGAAVAIVLAGGYARKVEDTVAIHVNTARVALGL
jgi:acetoin utilization deacetylase AcuC-like enzyme